MAASESITVGRDPKSRVFLLDERISARHVTFSSDGVGTLSIAAASCLRAGGLEATKLSRFSRPVVISIERVGESTNQALSTQMNSPHLWRNRNSLLLTDAPNGITSSHG